MILLIFEGPDDRKLIESAMELFNFDKEKSVCVFKGDIYALYSRLQAYDVFEGIDNSSDTVAILREILAARGDMSLDGIADSDISEIYLFFDYDFQNSRLSIDELNRRVAEMLKFFYEETSNGKLYINYPMVEAIRYTKTLPDSNYHQYTVTRKACKGFKKLAHDFSQYPSLDHLLLNNDAKESTHKKAQRIATIAQNWRYLIWMSACKANYICSGANEIPATSIPPDSIFASQQAKHVSKEEPEVAIISSAPLFVYDYFGAKVLYGSSAKGQTL